MGCVLHNPGNPSSSLPWPENRWSVLISRTNDTLQLGAIASRVVKFVFFLPQFTWDNRLLSCSRTPLPPSEELSMQASRRHVSASNVLSRGPLVEQEILDRGVVAKKRDG